jgi:hypothetical protein
VSDQPLDQLTDAELGQLVRNTAAFRAAAACAKFADEAQELRANDALAFDRLVRETHARQGTSVSKLETTGTIVESFIDVVADHAELADHPQDAAQESASEAITEGTQ